MHAMVQHDALFWAKVTKSPGCWEWRGYCNPGGYGRLNRSGVYTLAHRYAWQELVGAIPAGMDLCHTCDNPPCVNPDHLFLGTRAENMADAARKGRTTSGDRNPARIYRERMPRGSRNNRAKWTEADIIEIRRLHASGIRQVRIAEQTGMSQTNVSRIVRRTHWRHV